MVAEYERLRALPLGMAYTTGFSGAVLRRQGMLAWCQACPEVNPARSSGKPSAPVPVSEVIQVLAGMVLAVHQGGDHDD